MRKGENVHVPAEKVVEHYDTECLPQAGAFVRSWNFFRALIADLAFQDRTDTNNGTSRSLIPSSIPAAEEMLLDRLVSYIGCRIWVTHLASFVPAESATLGIVDKSAWC